MLAPAWFGYNGTNWFSTYNPENAASYGRFLGERYKGQDNIMWLLGGDFEPGIGAQNIRPAVAAHVSHAAAPIVIRGCAYRMGNPLAVLHLCPGRAFAGR